MEDCSMPDSPYTIVEESLRIGVSDASIDRISSSMRAVVKKIQDLRHLGIESNGLPLPKICVVGDQSTGKSSLIEGMSEIKVPRSVGCCTRCPMEINLSESEPEAPWTCRVLLMKKYIYDSSGKAKRPTSSKPLGPWIEQDPEEITFSILTDRALVRDTIKWAQLATLNPGRAYTDFIPGENQETNDSYTQVKFSPNVVRLDITAPGFPNLSFYDLPGVINVAEIDEEKYLVTLVENLVKTYIKADNCIALLTLPMTDDATNSSAARIIRDVPGARDRTLGVLTKPDRIELRDGSEYIQWHEILRGDKFSIGHGYYVVQNNPDPLVEHAIARQEELQFFSHPRWKNEFSEYSERFGTKALQAALSRLLLKQIQDSLPKITDKIIRQSLLVDNELATLPNPPSANVPYILCQKINKFIQNIDLHLRGGSPEFSFCKQWNGLADNFEEYFSKSQPVLRLREENPVIKIASFEYYDDDDGGDDDECQFTGTRAVNSRKRNNEAGNGTTPDGKRAKISTPAPGVSMNLPVHSASSKEVNTNPFHEFEGLVKVFTLDEIRMINADTCAYGIPSLGNPQAVETMNSIAVSHWRQPMERFLSFTYELIKCVLLEEVDKIFHQYQRTALYDEIRAIISGFLESIRLEHFDQAADQCDIEQSKPLTRAKNSINEFQEAALRDISKKRREVRARRYVEYMEANSSSARTKYDVNKVTDEEMGPDEFLKEIEMMAKTRAYYKIAAQRFVDTTCQLIYTKLFFRCQNELRFEIEQKLGILGENASERCMELMAEDQERQIRRTYLLKEKVKLDKAREWLKCAEASPEREPLFT
ncbi:hypothetical protein FQN57_004001 [Myotisia sp. PD_48]|nr:hypothetical protein FQN57_004001 [Myotisia sp. PD_48]